MKTLTVFAVLALLACAHAADFHGTWTSDNWFGGPTYFCPQGNVLYGVASNGVLLVGNIQGNNAEGNWYSGGRGYRNSYQGSFRITLDVDNLSFDGYYNKVDNADPIRWKESRLPAPAPSQPSTDQCLVPGNRLVQGRYASQYPGFPEGKAMICWNEATSEVYGSFISPDGYFDGWSVEGDTGFQGYIYTGNGNGHQGACILRATSDTEVRGWFWQGHLVRNNFPTSQPLLLTRIGDGVSAEGCQEFGPGFHTRFRGPPISSASSFSASFVAIVLVVVAAVFAL